LLPLCLVWLEPRLTPRPLLQLTPKGGKSELPSCPFFKKNYFGILSLYVTVVTRVIAQTTPKGINELIKPSALLAFKGSFLALTSYFLGLRAENILA
jgi:hypothetical protein